MKTILKNKNGIWIFIGIFIVCAIFIFSISSNSISGDSVLDPENYNSSSNISSCGDLDTEDSVYFLESNVNAAGTCFNIYGDEIMLDCQGNSITFAESEDDSYGVYISGNNVVVKNCVIRKTVGVNSGGYGVFADGANNFYAIGNDFDLTGTGFASIGLYNSDDSTVYSNIIYNDGTYSHGMVIRNSEDSSNISMNEIETAGDNSYGVYMIDSTNFDIFDNVFSSGNPGSNLIRLSGANQSKIYDNDIESDSINSNGIYLYNSHNNELEDNRISCARDNFFGFNIVSSDNNDILTNDFQIDGDYSYGYYEGNKSRDNSITENEITLTGASSRGIYLNDNEGSYFENNNIYTSGINSYGAFFSGSNDNLIDGLGISTLGDGSVGLYFDDPSSGNVFFELDITMGGIDTSSIYSRYSQDSIDFLDSSFDLFHLHSDEFGGSGITWNAIYNFNNSLYESLYFAANGDYTVNRNWPLSVKVLSIENNPVRNAIIHIQNNESSYGPFVTNGDGEISRVDVKEYSEDSEGKYYMPIYTVIVNYDDYTVNQSINISQTKSIEISLNISIEESSSSSGEEDSNNNLCLAKFDCEEWSECVDGTKTRFCINIFPECGLNDQPPKTVMKCKVEGEDPLFDIGLELLNNHLSIDEEKIIAKISLENIGIPSEGNVSLYYEINDNYGKIIDSGEEIIDVQNQFEYLKEFDVSKLKKGKYSLTTHITYENQTDPAISRTAFTKGATPIYMRIEVYVILVAIGFIFLAIFYRKKRSKGLLYIQNEIGRLGNDAEKKVAVYPYIRRAYSRLKKEDKEKVYPKIKRIYPMIKKGYKEKNK